MAICPTCGTPDPPLTAELINREVDWDYVESGGEGYEAFLHAIGERLTIKAVKRGSMDSYGYVSDSEAYVVVEIAGRYFKKEGLATSYSGILWNGPCSEVSATPRTVTVFDYL